MNKVVYHGNGHVTRQQTTESVEDLDIFNMSEEDEQEDPVFAAIVNHVVRQVQQSQEE